MTSLALVIAVGCTGRSGTDSKTKPGDDPPRASAPSHSDREQMYRPLTVSTNCYAQFNADEPSRRMITFHVILKGSLASNEASVVQLRGSCDYVPPGSNKIGYGGGRKAGWACRSQAYRLDNAVRQRSFEDPSPLSAYEDVSLPVLLAEDVRGFTGAEGWYGEWPEPRLESEGELVIDEFSINGGGQLRFSCADGPAGNGDMKGCRVSWRNVNMPEKVFLHGICGDNVVVPGLFVQAKPKQP